MRQGVYTTEINSIVFWRQYSLTAITVVIMTNAALATTKDIADCRNAGERKQWREAILSCTAAAEGGDAGAQMYVGVLYENGQGVTKNYKQAAHWYNLAAKQGQVEAQYNLGRMFHLGRGVVQNKQLAIGWFTLAAAKGLAEAQYNLGVIYSTEKDYKQALRWYVRAAEHGDISAKYNLGRMYGLGLGVPQDHVRAHMWFNLAAVAGDTNSVENRDIVARKMIQEQTARAQRMARDCAAKNFKAC